MRTEGRVRAAERNGGNWLRSWSGIGALFLMFAAAVLLASCGNAGDEPASGGGEETVPAGEEAESAGEAQAVSLADITDNPSEFYGKRVVISGLVTDELGANSFAIGGDEFVGGDAVPVLGAQALDQIVADPELLEESQGDLIQATGTVQQFSEINNDDVASDLNSEFFNPFTDQAALVADSVTITPQQGGGSAMGGGTTSDASDAAGVQVTLSAITDQPAEFYGQTVTVSAPVARVINPNAFVIVSDQAMEQNGGAFEDPATLAQQGVLVANTSGVNLTENQTVQVAGQVSQFDVVEFEQALGVEFNENSDVFSAFTGKPAIMASSVQQVS